MGAKTCETKGMTHWQDPSHFPEQLTVVAFDGACVPKGKHPVHHPARDKGFADEAIGARVCRVAEVIPEEVDVVPRDLTAEVRSNAV